MNKSEVLAFLDAEIERLQQARQLLSGSYGGSRNGNPRAFRGSSFGRPRRRMSADVRRRISEAQKKRWAARKRAAQK